MKTASLHLDGPGLRFTGRTGSGHEVVLDDAEGDAGPRPAELLLVALGACTAMDVISILRKKRQAVEDYGVSVEGVQRTDRPAAFTELRVRHLVRGAVDPEALRRAIELSVTRYCAVGATLSSGATTVAHAFQLERPDEVVSGVVGVTGPLRSLEDVPALN